ncbi:hypothetical protein C5C31_08760 [Rathayibacter rathayi]|nr:hypothetical protein C5C02_09075 [Rathayibacter rathayi]PPG75597.1 hypothetical protein C5C23_10010 [Rathayibacter rathayi]PPG87623.1 hypothetical protein C5C47_10050 [Rathayibacter rathayi]PPH22424.1 hypothetical protein C5C31_08760 [Rathayibacter rathayi]PPI75506.1 hypothetical protein C5E03_13565 [Rathayibacter rathayi]
MAVQWEHAFAWMAGLGYDVTSESRRMRAGGAVIRCRTFAVAQLWHDASAVTRRVDGGGSAISLVMEGRIPVTRGAMSIEVGKKRRALSIRLRERRQSRLRIRLARSSCGSE